MNVTDNNVLWSFRAKFPMPAKKPSGHFHFANTNTTSFTLLLTLVAICSVHAAEECTGPVLTSNSSSSSSSSSSGDTGNTNTMSDAALGAADKAAAAEAPAAPAPASDKRTLIFMHELGGLLCGCVCCLSISIFSSLCLSVSVCLFVTAFKH